ncbi:ribonuclease P protein component [Thiorhodospira sibirica]|uniref:ribonuclease P protein component n=1 Tax=Thiorhodospira sibirica TaxID=154347 RepID=UPI0002E0A578|nr:ribonuclease P protein component [Thiorhodospira sibirica]
MNLGETTQRYPKSSRLITPTQYRRVFTDAQRVFVHPFSVVLRSNDGDGPRLGLAISRKCARQAVARNRIKRLIRESFRQNQARLGSFDLVFMCRPGAAELRNAQLRGALEKLWLRLSK